MKNINSKLLLVLLLFISYINISCNSDYTNSELVEIKRERDSLQVLLSEIEQKYVFDSIRLVVDQSPENLLTPGSEYNLKFYFIGFNRNSYFAETDSPNKAFEDSIFSDRGIFHYNTVLDGNNNEFKGFISTNGRFGKNYEAVLHNPDLLEE